MGRLFDQKLKKGCEIQYMSRKYESKKNYPPKDFNKRGGSYQKRGQTENLAKVIANDSDVILKKSNIEKFVEYSEQFGRLCTDKRVTTTQIRGIFQEVKRLPKGFEESKYRLNLLRPKLAYQKGRFHNLTDLQYLLDNLIKKINSDEALENFKDFFEAIICYHKAFGGD